MNAVQLVGLGLAAKISVGRVCGDTLCREVSGEFAPPVTQGCLPDIEPLALLAHCLNNHMHVGMRFVGMQHHSVPMLQCELLAREVPHGLKHTLRGRSGWHREHEFMN